MIGRFVTVADPLLTVRLPEIVENISGSCVMNPQSHPPTPLQLQD